MADALSTIRARVVWKAGNLGNLTSSRIDENINEAILQLIGEVKPQEMWANQTFSTSSGTASYSFAALSGASNDILEILFVRNTTSDYEIKHASYEMWNRYQQLTSSSANLGDPYRWTRYQNNILLFSRIPDSTSRTIRVDYLKRPARLSADADTFPLNDEWKRPVEELAAAFTLQDMNSMEKAGAKLELYNSLITRRVGPEGDEDASPEGPAFIPISNLNLVS